MITAISAGSALLLLGLADLPADSSYRRFAENWLVGE